ncbi:MAG: 6-bladed beta-propeller [Gemmatimonadaceae bacterium]|nr:6-bladed beta-propeller [Gemmatimonadaceae bacterium]
MGATVASVLLASCEHAPRSSPWTGAVTDSAGVEMVVNPADGTWTDATAWTVAEVFAIGGPDAQGPSAFGDVSGVDVDAEGNVYVADDQVETVQVFDSAGAWQFSIGGPGEGPGELRRTLAGLFVAGDEVLIPNLSNQRVSRFTLRGEFVGSDGVDFGQGYPLRWGAPRGEHLVAQRRPISDTSARTAPGDAIVAGGDGGSVADTLAVLGTDQSVEIVGGAPKIHQFAPMPAWATSTDGRLVTALTDTWRFEVYEGSNGLVRVISRPFKRTGVSEAIKQVVRERLRDMYRAQHLPPQISEQFVGAMDFADVLPVFASVVWGPAGSLWVQELLSAEELADGGAAVQVEDMGSRRWGVFDAAGRYLGIVEFPERFVPIRAVGERFYGITRDELDVQSVKAYQVVMH